MVGTLHRAVAVAATLAAAALLPAASFAETTLPAPFQIDGVEQALSARATVGAEGRLVVVDLGAAENRSAPTYDDWPQVTLLGSDGATTATLHDVRKVCDYLCGEDPEECHYVARFSSRRPLDEIGTPLAALPGVVELADYGVASSSAGSPLVEAPADAPAQPVDASATGDHGAPARPVRVSTNPNDDAPTRSVDDPATRSTDFARPVWPPEQDGQTEYRLREAEAADRDVRLEYRWSPTGDVYAMEDRECTTRLHDAGLTELACSSFAMLFDGSRPLLVSLADYNEPAAEIVASFRHGEASYHVVRLGLKAQTVYGLLVDDGGTWHAVFRPRDYALMC